MRSTRRTGPSLVGLAFLLSAALMAAAPPPASAQQVLAPAEARYLLTRSQLESVRREIEELRPTHTRAVEALRAAREIGDEDRAEAIFRDDFVQPAVRMQSLGSELRERSRAFQEARREYLRALEARMDEIVTRLEDTELTQAGRDRINQQYVELSLTYREVERERNPIEEAMLRPIPTLSASETDGPGELRDKASYLEEQVASDYQAVIDFTSREIEVRENQLRLEREGADLLADLSRFDIDRLPGTGAGGAGGAVRPDDDPEPVQGDFIFAELPLEDQVELLRSIRAQAEEALAETLQRAGLFREMADGGSS